MCLNFFFGRGSAPDHAGDGLQCSHPKPPKWIKGCRFGQKRGGGQRNRKKEEGRGVKEEKKRGERVREVKEAREEELV